MILLVGVNYVIFVIYWILVFGRIVIYEIGDKVISIKGGQIVGFFVEIDEFDGYIQFMLYLDNDVVFCGIVKF